LPSLARFENSSFSLAVLGAEFNSINTIRLSPKGINSNIIKTGQKNFHSPLDIISSSFFFSLSLFFRLEVLVVTKPGL
jgi:hypothetical protein